MHERAIVKPTGARAKARRNSQGLRTRLHDDTMHVEQTPAARRWVGPLE
ncbi:MAG: hypothetical protein U5K28_12040 [Halobacteriales archaeon]|nr:hypothetical protein [Halobacteriales archaeon]